MEHLDEAAAEAAAALAELGYATDFSPASLVEVDRFFDSDDRDAALAGDAGAKVAMIGAYVGEVLRRALGGAWVPGDDEPMLAFANGEVTSPMQHTAMRWQSSVDTLAQYATGYGLVCVNLPQTAR